MQWKDKVKALGLAEGKANKFTRTLDRFNRMLADLDNRLDLEPPQEFMLPRIDGMEDMPFPEPVRGFPLWKKEKQVSPWSRKFWNEFMHKKMGQGEIPSRIPEMMAAVPHVSLPEGYVLDFFHQGDELGGMPIIYVRTATETPHPDEIDWGAHPWRGPEMKPFDRRLNMFILDGTPESYWELMLLGTIGGMFQVYWHAGSCIVTMFWRWKDFFMSPSNRIFTDDMIDRNTIDIERLREIDPAPTVTLTGDGADITYMQFNQNDGFRKLLFHISREGKIKHLGTLDSIKYRTDIIY